MQPPAVRHALPGLPISQALEFLDWSLGNRLAGTVFVIGLALLVASF
jgi:hypothetical protein